jgi:hypothetical protein
MVSHKVRIIGFALLGLFGVLSLSAKTHSPMPTSYCRSAMRPTAYLFPYQWERSPRCLTRHIRVFYEVQNPFQSHIIVCEWREEPPLPLPCSWRVAVVLSP